MTDTTTSPTDTDATPAIDAYVAMWNEPDEARRAELIAAAWTEDGAYVDPLAQASGHDGLNAMVTELRGQFPGHVIARTTGIDAHHGLVRFGWHLAGADGTVAVEGIDVGIVADDGRLSRMGGFMGPLPPLA
jgi:hypothetical protein